MKQCREHNCPLQDICRGAVDNETWWNIGEDCKIFAFVNAQADKIFALENRLKECENGYEGTLALERAKVRELTQANEQLSESYENLEKTKDELLAERSRLIMENERLRGKNTVHKVIELIKTKGYAYGKGDVSTGEENILGYQISIKKLDQIAKEIADE